MTSGPLDAVILDLDGVVTDTAALHAKAWKQTFDDYLARHAQEEHRNFTPFDIAADYRRYIDGKPRHDGIRSFLESRNLALPEGHPQDPSGEDTIYGLGNRKNQLFQKLLDEEPSYVFADAVQCVRAWRSAGMKTAIVSSSRNCGRVLERAGLTDLFDARVDGEVGERIHLRGKPAPDYFLEAARQLGVRPERVAVVEDAISGIEAAVHGGFGRVIGVARGEGGDALRNSGADVVVQDLRAADLDTGSRSETRGCPVTPCHALQHREWIASRLTGRCVVLLLDYDGTLTPIVRHPSEATLSSEMRALLTKLAGQCTLGIISGRDRLDVEKMVQVPNIVYAGSHGFDVAGPNELRLEYEQAQAALPALDQAERALRQELEGTAGAWLERKRFGLAVHYREAAEQDVQGVERAVDKARRQNPQLRTMSGKKVFELQPRVHWNKGQAILWLREALRLEPGDPVTVYIGDDTTDEDAFEVLRRRGDGLGIVVGVPYRATHASYWLRDCNEVREFLQLLLDISLPQPPS